MVKLLVGTQNPGKQREYQDLLHDLPVEWLGLGDVGLGDLDVDETSVTFEENARAKAIAYAQTSGLPTLADDSGLLFVGTLNGGLNILDRRGPRFGRFAHDIDSPILLPGNEVLDVHLRPSGDLIASGESTSDSVKGSPVDLVGVQVTKMVDIPELEVDVSSAMAALN